jgi:hypothetical protein
MALDERSGLDRSAALSAPSRRLISRFAPILNRPLVIGAITVLASFFCCSVLAQTNTVSEGKPHLAAASPAPAQHPHPASPDAVPLLFLVVLGLGGLALSQTRPTPRPAARPGSSYAGKNVVRGQELPEIIPPQPELSVVTREHHDHVVGFEPVGVVRMLNQ